MSAITATSDQNRALDRPPQSPLPFDHAQLLRVRVRPSDFARMLAVDKATVCRWQKKGLFAIGADGRIDPQLAMKQLLRNADPGRIRARLVRQAFGDLGDLRADAAKAADLERQVADLTKQLEREREQADFDYSRLDDWLAQFEARIANISQAERAALDGLAWRARLRDELLAVMHANDDLDELGRQLDSEIGLALAGPLPVRAPDEEEGAGAE